MTKEDALARMTASIEAIEGVREPGRTIIPGASVPALATPVALMAFGAATLFTLAKGMQSSIAHPNGKILLTEENDD